MILAFKPYSDELILNDGRAVFYIDVSDHDKIWNHAAEKYGGYSYQCDGSPVHTHIYLSNESFATTPTGRWFSDGPKLLLMRVNRCSLTRMSNFQKILRLIKERHGKEYDLRKIPNDDGKTFELFINGDIDGVTGNDDTLNKYMRELKPTCVEEIMTLAMLYIAKKIDVIDALINRDCDLVAASIKSMPSDVYNFAKIQAAEAAQRVYRFAYLKAHYRREFEEVVKK